MGFCIVRGCKSRSDSNNRGRKFHVVPRDNEMREKWIVAIGRTNLPKSGSVCSRHFLPEDYQLSRSGLSESLQKTAVPSQHLVPTKESENDDDPANYAEGAEDDDDLSQYYSTMDFENETTFKEFTTTIDTLDLEKEKDLPPLTCVDLFPDPPHLISLAEDPHADGSLADDDEFVGFRSNENKTEDDPVEIVNDNMSESSHTFKEDARHREGSNAEGSQKTASPRNVQRDEVKSSGVGSSVASAPVSPASYFSSAESVVSTASSSKKIKKRFCRECNLHFRKTRELHEHLKTHIRLPEIRVERLSDADEKVKEYLSSLSPKPSPTHGSLKLKLKLLDSQNFEVVTNKKEDKPPATESEVPKPASIPYKTEVSESVPVDTFTEDTSTKMSNTFLQPENRYFECPTFDGLESFAEEMMNTGEATEDLLKKLLETNKEPPMYQKETDWPSNANEFISIDSLAPRCNVCHMNFSHPKYLYEHKRMTGHDFQPRMADHPAIPTSQPDYGHQNQNSYMQQSHPPPQNLPPLYQMAQMRGNFSSFGPRLNVRQIMQHQQHHQQPSPPPGFHPSQCMMTRTPPPLYRMNGNPPNFPPNRYIEKRIDMYGSGPGPGPQFLNGNQHVNPDMMRQPIFLKSRLQKAIRGRSQGPTSDIPMSPGILTQQTAIRPRFLGPTPQMPGQMQFQRARVQTPPKPGEPPAKKVKMESEPNHYSSSSSSGIVSPGMSTSPGMPIIQSVHSGHTNPFPVMNDKPKEPSPTEQANAGPKGAAKNPKDVANILATRGITVTHKGKTSFVALENKGGNSANASAQEAVQKLQANNSVSIISKKKPAEMNTPKLAAPTAETGHRVTTKFLSCPVITCKEKFLTTEGVNRHAFRWHGIPLPNAERIQKRMGRCRLCHHLCSSPEALQEHIRREHEPTVNEIGIPIVDLRNEEVKRKLAGLGIFNYVPLTAAGASTSSLAFPVVSVQGTNNSSICNLLGLGATSVLSLGPVKSIAVRKPSNENK